MDLTNRDAFADHADVPSALKATLGTDVDAPLVTIAIPTYRRPDKLVAVVKSAVSQTFDRPVEIIVVDNDPDEASARAIIESLPADPARPVRYYVNERNTGMFGNWNRCIELARAPWVTILNDDDLLRPKFLERSFRALDRDPAIDGLVCTKQFHNWDTGRLVGSAARRFAKRLAFRWRFDRHGLKRVGPRNLFFGNELENGLGFLFRRNVAVAMGGYKAEEFPASDFFFYIRFCVAHNLYWLYEDLADIGIGENESVNKATIRKSITLANDFYLTMSERFVPESWYALRLQLTANQVLAYRLRFNVDFTPDDIRGIEEALDGTLPPPSFGRIRRFRLFHGGY